MLIKVYGFLDLSAGIAMLLLRFWGNSAMQIISLALAAYVLIKALAYVRDIASIVDIFAAVFLVLAAFGFLHVLSCVFALWLIQKGITSLFLS